MIAETRALGTQVVLATSRVPLAVVPILLDLGLIEPAVFIASQGAVLGNVSGDGALRILAQEPIPLEDARRTARTAEKHGLTVNWFTPRSWFVTRIDDAVRAEAEIVGLEPKVCDLGQLAEAPDKIMLMSIPRSGLPGELSLPPTVHAERSNAHYVEITRRGIDKSTALKGHCAQSSIPAASVAAIGDGPNDLALFSFAGLSIAPANADPRVLTEATLVTTSNDEDGVATALASLMGIPDSPHRERIRQG